MAQFSFHSSVGDLTLSEEGGKIVSLDWGWSSLSHKTDFLEKTKLLIDAYFDGQKPNFTIDLDPAGTDFQKNVWKAIMDIPYGKVTTYGEIANHLNSHPRAVGSACGLNPIPIIIPCHRVMGKKGQLTGYSGGEGIETKQYLLNLEQSLI